MQRKSTVATVLAIGMVAVFLTGWWTPRASSAAASADKPNVVFNLTSGKEDLHAVTMALQLANHALDDGRAVTLFFNVRAVEFARADLTDAAVFADNPPIREMLAKLHERGATLLVCPACAAKMGVKREGLMPGATFATRATLFGKLDASAVVFSY
jgi:predicted peroxiredoxin